MFFFWFGLVFLAPSMFGRDLIEQVRDDSKNSESLFFVPVIVTKCIEAVEANGECGIAFFRFWLVFILPFTRFPRAPFCSFPPSTDVILLFIKFVPFFLVILKC